jgi:PiT family inorganic phosphate transporter
MTVALLCAAALLGFANGANDNFKGVATLLGSRSTGYRTALVWATVTTALGSIAAAWLAQGLLVRFSGKGILPDEVVGQLGFPLLVAAAAGLSVLGATRLGMPVSTTHALLGAMIGTGLSAHAEVRWTPLLTSMVAPLLISPVLAACLTVPLYAALRRARRTSGVTKETCLCVGPQVVEIMTAGTALSTEIRTEALSVSLGTTVECRERYAGQLFGIDARQTLDVMHFLTAGLISFARGLNDTPKIAALLLTGAAMGAQPAVASIGAAIALGGWLAARRVGNRVSFGITEMNAGQGFAANLASAALVIGASRFGLPVSTTHVSCGALFGIGMVTGQGHWSVIGRILLAWLTTAPLAAGIALLLHFLL